MNYFRRNSGLPVICVGALLFQLATSVDAARPLIPLTGAPAVDVKVDSGCPSTADSINLNISTTRGADASGTLASSTRATGTNIVDVYAALLRPDGHMFSLNALSEPDVLYPMVSGWDVVTADNLIATFPMNQMPINEAGFYSLYIAFFESQNRSSAGRPLVALPPSLVAAAYDKFYTDPNPGAPTSSKCACTSGLWNLNYHATTTVDLGVYKLTAVWDGAIDLDATADLTRPLVLLNPKQVTGSGTLTFKETAELPSLGCVGTTNASAPVTVTGTASTGKFDLTVNTPSVDTSVTMTCTNTSPPGSITMPFTVPANSSSVTVPAVDGAEIDMAQAVPLSSGRPVIPISSTPSTTSGSGSVIRIEGNYKANCKA